MCRTKWILGGKSVDMLRMKRVTFSCFKKWREIYGFMAHFLNTIHLNLKDIEVKKLKSKWSYKLLVLMSKLSCLLYCHIESKVIKFVCWVWLNSAPLLYIVLHFRGEIWFCLIVSFTSLSRLQCYIQWKDQFQDLIFLYIMESAQQHTVWRI